MRSFVLRKHVNPLLKMSSVGVLGFLIAGCSSGFERFDTTYYDAGKPQPTAASNPYPGTVDPTTTASTSAAVDNFAPVAEVGPRVDPQGIYHRPEPTYAQPSYQAAQPAYQPAYQQQRQPLSGYQAQPSYGTTSASTIQSQPLAPAEAPSYTPPKPDPVVSQPKPAAAPTTPKTVYIPPSTPDPVTTSAIESSGDARESGWTSTGGTTITVRQGETLYNLSKRYGVPATEIQRVNGLTSAQSLQAGQKIIIPNYVFSNSAPISAPDHDSKTRAARASTGYRGEAQPSKVAVPTHRPYTQTAAISPSGTTEDASSKRYEPRTISAPPSDAKTPDHSITTSSVSATSGFHVVKSGDSLSRIASQNGITVAALQNANGLTGSSIQIGQRLVIPDGGMAPSKTVVAKKDEPVTPVDRMTTASVKAPEKSETPAPARTGISEFRWPVKGRVVTRFGDRTDSGKNEGIDISVPEGTAVRATENGVVIYAGSEISSYGNLILVRHEDGWVSAYAHNRDFEVKKGDQVRRGQIIARSGKTGETDRPKLHFELRKNSVPVDPSKHLAGA